MTQEVIGDVVYRKDMPEFRFRIVGENADFPEFWDVEPVVKYKGFGSWKGTRMIAKNDERWEVLSDKSKESTSLP